MHYHIGIDVGGSHLSSSLIKEEKGLLIPGDVSHLQIDSNAPASKIIADIVNAIKASLANINSQKISGLALSIPGPFQYEEGISEISGLGKYDSLFGMDLRVSLMSALQYDGIACDRIYFQNDAESFLIGAQEQLSIEKENILAITLGTGLGSASFWSEELHEGVPWKGYLYNIPFKDGDAEDYFSTQWFLKKAVQSGITGAEKLNGVKELLTQYDESSAVREICRQFSENLASFMNDLFRESQPDRLILGGNIMKSYHYFRDDFEKCLDFETSVDYIGDTSGCACLGAVLGMNGKQREKKQIRKTKSSLLPLKKKIPSGRIRHLSFISSPQWQNLPGLCFIKYIHRRATRKKRGD